jgi:hypothetical protein
MVHCGDLVAICTLSSTGTNQSAWVKADGSLWATGQGYDVDSPNICRGDDTNPTEPIQIPTNAPVTSADIRIVGGGHSWLVYTDVFGAIWKCGTEAGRIIEPPEPVHMSELDNMRKFPDASYTKFGDTWYYKVTPKDGKTFGETVTSCALPITNIPPEIDDIIIK